MKRLIGLALLLAFAVYGCKEKALKSPTPKKEFSYFEISFRSFGQLKVRQLGNNFSFCVDSNNIYFAPDPIPEDLWHNEIRYGLLPDSMSRLIDTFVHQLKNDTIIKSIYHPVSHGWSTAIKTITGNDTIRVLQAGDISKPVLMLLTRLDSFIHQSKHDHFNSFMTFETKKRITPTPSPILHVK